jgi:3-hydroxyisobutyrate dehydrogenase-like beta-hydroxyacid dehydrogenase
VKEKPTLGFIGLGRMGGPMAARFAGAGYPLVVFDLNDEAAGAFVDRGATRGISPADVASRAGIVLLCLPTPDAVEAVSLGTRGIVHGSRARTLIDLGTTGPAMERRVASGVAAHGVTLVDAPVTGGISGARAGTLAVMASCPPGVFAAVAPLLETLGRVFHVGEAAGLGQTAKLANNLLSAAALAVSAEAMAMGVKAGIDARVLLDIINAGSGRNSATEDKFPRAILPGTFDFGMSTGLFFKDVHLSVDEAESLGVPMVVGSAVRQMFAVTRARFGPASDFTCIAKVIEEWAGVAIRA